MGMNEPVISGLPSKNTNTHVPSLTIILKSGILDQPALTFSRNLMTVKKKSIPWNAIELELMSGD